MARSDPAGPLNRWERTAIALLCIVVVAFTSYIFYRSCFRARRMGDAGVYLRAAWAVRSGADLYKVTDNNGWSYTYPPALAVFMMPLADAPAGEPRPWMIPYEASVAIWLGIQLGAMVLAVHWVAQAVAESSPDPGSRLWPRWRRRWWQARVQPAAICLIGIGATLSRSQVNLMVLLFIAGMMLCLVRGKRFTAGIWLAAAAALKVIPAFLLLYGLWRRDTRHLAGFAAGMFLILGVVPSIAVGPQRAFELNRRFLDMMVLARFGDHEDKSKVTEHDRAVDNQAIVAVSYNIRNPGKIEQTAQAAPDRLDKLIHVGIGGVICLITLGAIWKRDRARSHRPRTDVLFISLLTVVMVIVSPLAHLHYFVLALPLVATLWASSRERGGPTPLFWGASGVYFAANTLTHVEALRTLKYLGLSGFTNIALWAVGIREALRPEPARHTPEP